VNDTRERYSREGILAFAEQFPFFRLIGLEILDLEPMWSKARLRFRSDLTQPVGIMHGGVIASLVDSGIAHALLLTDRFQELRDEGGALVSVDLRIKYLRPVSDGEIVCESKVLRLGRQIKHAESIETNSEGKEVARGDATYMAVTKARLERD
jgi:acyl-CoA thioesterase